MSSSRSKQKGTAGEKEVRDVLTELTGRKVRRMPASARWDLELPGDDGTLDVLATRPDFGQWLVSMDIRDFARLLSTGELPTVHIEVKRHKKFAHHSIFKEKFGGGMGR